MEDCVAIVGLGLIGGSVALALKERGLARRVLAVGRDPGKLAPAVEQGMIDAVADLPDAARQADLMLFCTPVDRIADGVLAAAAHARPGTLLTDAGSVKGPICHRLAGQLPDGVTFIGGHPLAGSEKQGFTHARADLFVDRLCVLTPDAQAPAPPIERLTCFWQGIGAQVVRLPPEEHDRILAHTSHLPHMIAALLAGGLDEAQRPFAATGFRDTTRIAAGDPDLWTSILLQNAGHIAEALSRLEWQIEEAQSALLSGDAAAVRKMLERGKAVRDGL